MKLFIVVLVVGLITTALPVGTVSAADSPVAVAAPATTAPGYAASVDSSRYRFYNGYWWYWMPDNHWMCYVNGQWVNPSPPVQANPPVQTSPGMPVQASVPVYPYQYNVVPQPYYTPYPYGYYPYPYYGGGVYLGFGGGSGGYWHGGYGGYHH